MKTKESKELVHIVLDNVQHSLSLPQIETLKPIIRYFHDNRMLKFGLINGKFVSGIVRNYTFEEIVAPLNEIIPLEIELESGERIWFYEIGTVEPL